MPTNEEILSRISQLEEEKRQASPTILGSIQKGMGAGIEGLSRLPSELNEAFLNSTFGLSRPMGATEKADLAGRTSSAVLGGIGGAKLGALAGTALAPVTGGISIPAGALLGAAGGGSGGATLWDAALEYLGGKPKTTPQEKAYNFGYGLSQDLALTGATKGVSKLARNVPVAGAKLQQAARGMRARGLGFTESPSELRKAYNRGIAYTDELGRVIGDVDDAANIAQGNLHRIEQSIDVMEKDGFFKTLNTNDPRVILNKLRGKSDQFFEEVAEITEQADAGMKPGDIAIPDFKTARAVIEELQPEAKAQAERLLGLYEDDWLNSKSHKVTDLLEFKRSINTGQAFKGKSPRLIADTPHAFRRALYNDARKSVEEAIEQFHPDGAAAAQRAVDINQKWSHYLDFDDFAKGAVNKGSIYDALTSYQGNLRRGAEGTIAYGVTGSPAAAGGIMGIDLATDMLSRGRPMSTANALRTWSKVLNNKLTQSALYPAGKYMTEKGFAVVPGLREYSAGPQGIPEQGYGSTDMSDEQLMQRIRQLENEKSKTSSRPNIISRLSNAAMGAMASNAYADTGVPSQDRPFIDMTDEELGRMSPESEWVESFKTGQTGHSPLLRAVAQAESNFNPKAKSKIGAQGLMQFMPDTADWVLKKMGSDAEYDPHDPIQQVDMADWYLNEYLLPKFGGSTSLALAAYNWGEGNVRKAMGKYGDSWSDIKMAAPKETKSYVTKVARYMNELDKG
jgi:hypothetical protein